MVSREAVVSKAYEWLGMTERTGNNDIWFADDWGITGSSWCFAFVQSCFYYAGAPLPTTTLYCPSGVQYARDNGESVEVGGAPIRGDIVFFTWGNGYGRWTPGTGDHVGIVTGWDGGDWINTIEGNVGSPQGVYEKSRSISDVVICFWRPTVYDDSLAPAAIPAAAGGVPNGSNVLAVQQWCQAHGFNPGPLDGEYGPMTAAGISGWQQALANAGFNPGPIDGDWGPLTTAATAAWLSSPTATPALAPAQPEDDMFDDNDRARLAQIADGAIRASTKNAAVSFVRDPRDGSIWIVWGLMWRRYIGTPELLEGYQNWARIMYGTDAEIRDWNPVHIDDVPRADKSMASPAPEPAPEPEPSPGPPLPVPRPDPPTPEPEPEPDTPPATSDDVVHRVTELEQNVARILQILEALKQQPPAA